MASPRTPRQAVSHRWAPVAAPVLALLALLQLTAGVVTAVALDGSPATSVPSVHRARAVPPGGDGLVDARDRTAAVGRLLAARSAAVLARDRAGFLATVDPAATELRARQAALFDALGQVPLASWDYVLTPDATRPPDSRLDGRYGGADRWWAPEVSLRYALAGFDTRPTSVAHGLTFVRRGGSWLLGADDDFAAVGHPTPRALWDRGPVLAVRARGTLVLGHPESAGLLRDVARDAAEAIPRVSAVWGAAWQRSVVVVVPRDTAELAGLLGSDGDLSRLAAIATAELAGKDFDPAGDRVLINPGPFSTLSALGRRVVLTHELSHVATRRATGPAVPVWLAEGLADTIAYRGVDLPLAVSAPELRAEVRAGRLPASLPGDQDFAGANPRLAQAYEQAWLAVRLLAERHGDARLLAFYRAVGAARDVDAEQAVRTALQAELGTTPDALLAEWRASLRRQLG